MRLEKYKLSDVAKVEISGVDKKIKEGETPVKLCNFTDVYHNWAITTGMADTFMEATAKASEIEKFTIKKGQVAFTKDRETRDDIGIPTYIADNFENVLLGYHCALITPDESQLSGKYLNAFMHSAYMAFSQAIKPIVMYQLLIIEETDRIIKKRDELLPLLMNGQVSIQ